MHPHRKEQHQTPAETRKHGSHLNFVDLILRGLDIHRIVRQRRIRGAAVGIALVGSWIDLGVVLAHGEDHCGVLPNLHVIPDNAGVAVGDSPVRERALREPQRSLFCPGPHPQDQGPTGQRGFLAVLLHLEGLHGRAVHLDSHGLSDDDLTALSSMQSLTG